MTIRVADVQGTSKYPWAEWLDGRVWLLRTPVYGDDFACLPESMQSSVRRWATKYGLAVTTRLVVQGVLLQTYPDGSTWKPNLAAINENSIKKAMANPR